MAERAPFQETQYAFAAHLRDPAGTPAPVGIEERRIRIYRELFFNNLHSLLSKTFPVLKRLHSDDDFRRLVRAFMKTHRASTPYFLQLPGEFVAFLEAEYEPVDTDFPFLTELAHYEYIELALSVTDIENDTDGVDPDGDLMDGVPVRSSLAWLYAYHFPVHRISADFQPNEPDPQPHYLAVVRDRNDKVRFHELNPVSAALFDALADTAAKKTGRELLTALGQSAGFGDIQAFIEHGRSALEHFRATEIVIGAAAPD